MPESKEDSTRVTWDLMDQELLGGYGENPHGLKEPEVDAVMRPIERELERIVDTLRAMKGTEYTHTDLHHVQESLGHIDAVYNEGRFAIPGASGVPAGQAHAAELLHSAHELLRDRLEEAHYYEMDSRLRFFHNLLTNMSIALDDLSHKPHLKAKDIACYRTRLAEVDAHFQDVKRHARTTGEGPLDGEEDIKKLVSRNFDKVHSMLMLQTDYYKVDPALHWLHDRLVNVVHGLEALKARGGKVKESELMKYCHQLQKIEKHSVNGVFVVEGKTPAGQGVLSELVGTARRLIHALDSDLSA